MRLHRRKASSGVLGVNVTVRRGLQLHGSVQRVICDWSWPLEFDGANIVPAKGYASLAVVDSHPRALALLQVV